MKDARYVIRVGHDNATPQTADYQLERVREKVRPLGGHAMNLRVSRRALEFDVFCKPDAELHLFLNALDTLGTVLTYRRLDVPPPSATAAEIIAEARLLFNEERYWEAHEVLEALWKPAKGTEKQLLQGIILTAAALVHVQKNEIKVVEPMLEDAARRLENQEATYYGLDVDRFLTGVKKLIAGKTLYFPAI